MSDLSGTEPSIRAHKSAAWSQKLLALWTEWKQKRDNKTQSITMVELRRYLAAECNCRHGHCDHCNIRLDDMYH